MSENNIQSNSSQASPKEIVQKYLPFLPWLLLSVVIALSIAFVKLRYSTPIYSVSGKILVKSKNPYGNSAEKFGNIFSLPDDNDNINNEIEIIKSRSMATRVIRSLDLQKQNYIRGKIRTSITHPSDMPFMWIIYTPKDSINDVSLLVKIVDNKKFRINEQTKDYYFNQRIKLNGIEFELHPTEAYLLRTDPNEYILNWQNEDVMSPGLSGSLNVVRVEGTSVINLTYSTDNIKLGLDIINQYMKEYVQSSFEDKKLIAISTLQFIDTQLDTLKKELGGVEQNLQIFRQKNELFAPDEQTKLFFDDLTSSRKDITSQGIKLKVIEYLSNYMNDPSNSDKLVPSNLGIEEPTLLAQLTEFNQLQLRKETYLRTTQPGNPLIQNIVTAIEKIRRDILENLRNVRNALMMENGELSSRNKVANEKIRAIPVKQKQLLEVTRRQAILQELYSFLLQKKLETAISSAATTSDIMILEPAIASDTPVSPNQKGLYTFALFLGLLIPAGIIFLVEFLNDKVKSKEDITKSTSAPVLGEVGHAEDIGDALVVKQNNRSFISEQFRIIRSNFQYVVPKADKQVLLVTSSFSGEGKSFISTNVGAVLALSGKRTVILEMDIRKPKILKGLGMNERKGITNYIVSSIPVSDITHEVPGIENLYVIPCGPVPPNPAEMLLDEKVGLLFAELKSRFDIIIIDSAPVGMVSDAITLANHADATVYIVRHNYTLKKQIQMIDALYQKKKLPHLSIIINDISAKDGYGSYYGYGYGYGYG
ncbi:MAG: polysaccharide biosynthesis tyrosine autokinase, partial [Pedobacter agri]